jgi:hypothetical protein
MNIEIKLVGIVEPFDQKDEPDLGERQAKTYGIRIRLTSVQAVHGIESQNRRCKETR